MNRFFSPLPIAQFYGIAIVRIVTGFFLAYHGWEVFSTATMNSYDWIFKDSSTQKTLVYIGKAAELVAGVLLILGLFTRPAALLTIGTLGYVAFIIGNGKIWYDAQHPFLFVLLGILFLFTGPGAWALDHYLHRKTYK